MRIASAFTCTPLLAAILCGSTAAADITAQQVWDNWSAQMEDFGQSYATGDQEMSGDTLTISNLRIDLSDDEISVLAQVGDIRLTELGDGTVSIEIPESYPLTLDFTPPFDEPSTLNIIVAQSGMEILVSGDPDALVYDVTAGLYSFTVDSFEGDGAKGLELGTNALTMRDIAGTYRVTAGEVSDYEYMIDLGALDLDVDLSEPSNASRIKMTADAADVSMSLKLNAFQGINPDADTPLFVDGAGMETGYSFSDLRYTFDLEADGETASGTVTSAKGDMTASFGFDQMVYAAAGEQLDFNLTIPQEIPFPIDMTLAKYGMDFDIPLSQGEGGPRDARIAFHLTELNVNDILWNLLDPQSVLPRDAVTVALGLDAKVTPFFDLLDPQQEQARAMTDVMGELNALDITEFTVRAGGADITGDGAFTFDNTDLDTFDGFPRPQGEVNFAINGLNGLIDNLTEIGLIPADQAMMPRMMLGMFATPVGDDMLTSTIGVNAQGHVIANGQRLR